MNKIKKTIKINLNCFFIEDNQYNQQNFYKKIDITYEVVYSIRTFIACSYKFILKSLNQYIFGSNINQNN